MALFAFGLTHTTASANPIAPVSLAGTLHLFENGFPYYGPVWIDITCTNPDLPDSMVSVSTLCVRDCPIRDGDFYYGNSCDLTVRSLAGTTVIRDFLTPDLHRRVHEFEFSADVDLGARACTIRSEAGGGFSGDRSGCAWMGPIDVPETFPFPWILAVALAWLLENPMLLLLVRGFWGRTRLSAWRILCVVSLTNALTVTGLGLAAAALTGTSGPPSEILIAGICGAELAVTVLESLVYRKAFRIPFGKAGIASLTANMISYLAGIWLFGGYA
jgi:hypothetical protein